jgi:hypothetical protein
MKHWRPEGRSSDWTVAITFAVLFGLAVAFLLAVAP